jgi:beta-fructofuranosidase
LDGRRWYAAKSCPKAGSPDKRISFGWIGDYVDEEGKWLWGGDLGVPRELMADGQGNLHLRIASEVVHHLEKSYLLLPEISMPSTARLSCTGATAMMFPDLDPVDNADVYMTFGVTSCSAHSFGLVLQADQEDKGYRVQFSPSSGGKFTVSLLTDFPALDDFWADQYKLYLPRGVDGPELIRHESVDVGAGASLLLQGQTVQIFCGGRSMSFRLPLPHVSPTGASEGELKRPRPLGWFVEDGEVELKNIMIRVAGDETQL